MKSRLLGALSACVFMLMSTATSAALVDNGNGLIYDDVLKITWAQPDNARNWDAANTWASGLTLGGVSGWRLPYISVAEGAGPFTGTPVDCSTASESACRDNELGYMYYHNLGGIRNEEILINNDDPDLALFSTLRSYGYWSGTEFESSVDLFLDNAWLLDFDGGRSFTNGKIVPYYSWAVHPGNVGAVPVPAAIYLFGSGLLGLIGIARRKKV